MKNLKIPTKKELVTLQKQYGSDPKIAKAKEVTPKTVYIWRKRRGVSSILFNLEKRNINILREHKKNKTVKQISESFGLSITQIRRIIKRGG